MKNTNNHQHVSLFRLVVYIASSGLLCFSWSAGLSIDSWPALLSYALFCTAALSLSESKVGKWVWTRLLIVLLLLGRYFDYQALAMSAEYDTAMIAMKMMMIVTIIQNIVLGIYITASVWVLQRELHVMMRLFGYAVAVCLALMLMPALRHTITFIVLAII